MMNRFTVELRQGRATLFGAVFGYLTFTAAALAAPILYGVDSGTGSVVAIDSNGSLGSVASGFGFAEGLAIDSLDNAFVANWTNSTISRITPAGAVSTFASGMSQPHDMEFDGTGMLYVSTDAGGGSISRITPGGSVSTFKSGLNFPHSMVFDSSNNLYCTTEGSALITKITPAGTVSTYASGMSQPGDLVFDSASNLYVLNLGDSTIKKVTPGGSVSNFVSLSGIGPRALAIDNSDNLYFNLNGTLSRLTPSGVLTTMASGVPNFYDLELAPNVPEPTASLAAGVAGSLALGGRRRPKKHDAGRAG